MNLRLFLSILFIYTGTYSYTQQLKLDKGPEDYQLFARDKNDKATCSIAINSVKSILKANPGFHTMSDIVVPGYIN